MTTFIRGKQGLIDEITKDRRAYANRLVNDDKRRDDRVSHMTKHQRALIQAEVNALNGVLSLLSISVLLTEAEYDARFNGGKPS